MLKMGMPPLLRPEQIGLRLPGEAGDKFLLGLFIYAVSRDARAQINGNMRIDASTAVKAPLCVEIRLAVTSYAGKNAGPADDYRLLERVMQIWHDSGELPLTTPLQPSRVAAPRIELLNLDQDEISKISQFNDVPYSLSLFYRIAPIAIPSRTRITSAPVSAVDYAGGSE